MALCETLESVVSDQIHPLKFTDCLSQFSFVPRLGRARVLSLAT